MTPDALADALLDCSLPRSEWTHRGHVTACFALVRRLGAREALAVLRTAIPAYNVSVGGQNTDHSGYHDTLTAYFVWAIAHAVDAGAALEDVLTDPLVQVDAPLRFWSRERLFTVEARRGWLPPDLVAPGDEEAPPLAGPLEAPRSAAAA